MKIVIIGGVAAGATAAARARRVNESAEITIFEKGDYVSFANCGLPYYVGGDIKERGRLLLVTPELFRERYNINVRTGCEVTEINRKSKRVSVVCRGEAFEESYDKLIIATGGEPITPPVPGTELYGVSKVFTVPDADRIKEMTDNGVKSAVVVGGGFIGIETAEALLKLGIKTTLVEAQSQLMSGFDPEFSLPMERRLAAMGLEIRLGVSLKSISGSEKAESIELSDGSTIPADLVIMAVGVRPRTSLAQKAGLSLGITGGIKVNAAMQTDDPDIYAAGDAVESLHLVSKRPVRIPLAGSANKQGRVAGTNAAGGRLLFNGVLGTSIIKIGGLTAGRTGLSEREAKAEKLEYYTIFVPAASNATYYPGSGWMILKLVAEKFTGRVLGAQAVGEKGVDKRIDVLATAIYGGLSVLDLENLDLAYAPPFSSAKDPSILAGMIAANILRGDVKTVTPQELSDFLSRENAGLIDVRTPREWDSGHIEGAINLPVDKLRERMNEIDASKKYVVYCGVGYRAYLACRILAQHGFDVYNMTGGYNAYAMDV